MTGGRTAEMTREGSARTWLAALVGIGAWMAHIMALSSLIALTCERPAVEWVLHLTTVSLAAVTALGMWWCWSLVRGGGDDELAPTRAGRERFVGLFGLLTGAISVLLILWEGAYVFFLDACA